MAGNKYLINNSGNLSEARATQVSAGAATAGALIAANTAGVLDSTFLPAGIGPDAISAPATAAIAANSLVNVYSNSGTLSLRPADNTVAGSEANAYSTAAIASGATGTVNLGNGIVTGFSGLTIGAMAYLGTVGAVVSAAPSASGNIVQQVGKALSATSIQFAPQQTITVA